jgi:predicted nucleotidyltransferase
MENPVPASDIRPLEPLLDRIVASLGPEEIWLFGSRAEGRARPDSDYDLLVVLPDGSPEAHLDIVSVWTLVRGLDIPADIIPCTRAEFEEEKQEIDTLARAAFLRGKRIYERRTEVKPADFIGFLAGDPELADEIERIGTVEREREALPGFYAVEPR